MGSFSKKSFVNTKRIDSIWTFENQNGVMSFPWYGDSHYLSLDIDKLCLYITAGVNFLY